MAKTASWRDELWRFYERVFGKNYRNYIHRLSNKESEVTVSFHVKGDELVVIASPSSLHVIKRKGMATDHPEEVHNSAFSKADLKAITPLIKEAQPR
jgi:hypothetical protein